MNILLINAICYTSEYKNIQRAFSIKDTMIYDLCLAFKKQGHSVTLYAAEPYKPLNDEYYPFNIVWGKCIFKSIFLPNKFPFVKGIFNYIKNNRFDLIISSEVFSLCTLSAVLSNKNKLIIWHELAKHNAIFRKIPSYIWYNFIARFFMKNCVVVARSEDARDFISRYCSMTLSTFIDHGVNLDKFPCSTIKKDYFVVCSQLIYRKRIDEILKKFSLFLEYTNKKFSLYIIGDGELRTKLELLCYELGIAKYVYFFGKLSHSELIPILSQAKASLINTEKDNSMISIVESIAVATPVLTTPVPLNSRYIKQYKLGIANEWNYKDLIEIVKNNEEYVRNCMSFRDYVSTNYKVKQFISIYDEFINNHTYKN